MEVYIDNRALGNVVKGDVHDCKKAYVERALKAYDTQLYLKWNPLKTILPNGKTYFMPPPGEYWRGFGRGCWELRRRPNEKTAVPTWELGDSIVFSLEYLETDVIHCVKDFQYLNYDIVKWVSDNDTWKFQNWAHDLEYREDQSYNKELDASQADLKYAIKQERRAMRAFQDELKSGKSPLEFLSGNW
jgi:hypothetical protein